MAQYRATIQGMRGEASRLGTKVSGIQSHTNAWDIGVGVYILHVHGTDVIRVSLTGGSNGDSLEHIGTYKVINDKPQRINQ